MASKVDFADLVFCSDFVDEVAQEGSKVADVCLAWWLLPFAVIAPDVGWSASLEVVEDNTRDVAVIRTPFRSLANPLTVGKFKMPKPKLAPSFLFPKRHSRAVEQDLRSG